METNESLNMIFETCEKKMQNTLKFFADILHNTRTGRASLELFHQLKVRCYNDTFLNIEELANMQLRDAQTVVLTPWDKSVIPNIIKAIAKEMQLNPSNDGTNIFINIPPLSEERRKEILKQTKHKAEEARIALRNIRQQINKDISKQSEQKGISEDDIKNMQTQIQHITNKNIVQIEHMLNQKSKEIMTI